MKVSDLYVDGPLTDRDVHIVGTGPSMSVFPVELLMGNTCVLLNDAQKYFPKLGPVAFSNNLKFLTDCTLPYQVVKARLKFENPLSASNNPEEDDNHVRWEDPRYYCFSYREPPWDKVSHHDETTLWKEECYYWAPHGGSVAHFAVQFAMWCGARSITLVGCDCAEIGPLKYVKSKKQSKLSRHNYIAYQYGLLRLSRDAHRRGVPMVSLTPFFGLGWHIEQFEEMRCLRK